MIGLPATQDPISVSAPWFFSLSIANFRITAPRSYAVHLGLGHESNALRAAITARLTSSAALCGVVVRTSAVAGSRTLIVRPEVAGSRSLPMMFSWGRAKKLLAGDLEPALVVSMSCLLRSLHCGSRYYHHPHSRPDSCRRGNAGVPQARGIGADGLIV